MFKALCVDVVLLDEEALDPSGVVLDEEDCEAVLEDVAAVPLPLLFLKGEDTVLKKHILKMNVILY